MLAFFRDSIVSPSQSEHCRRMEVSAVSVSFHQIRLVGRLRYFPSISFRHCPCTMRESLPISKCVYLRLYLRGDPARSLLPKQHPRRHCWRECTPTRAPHLIRNCSTTRFGWYSSFSGRAPRMNNASSRWR